MNKHLIICVLVSVAAFGQAQTPLTITQSAGSATGELRLQERRTNGTDYVGLKAPQSVAASTVWTLPTADGTSGQCLQTDGAGVLSFAACAGTAPFIDSTAIIKGSADATKLLKIEVDGFTTATTRTLTPQNASYTIAGTDIAQTFTQAQTITGSSTAPTALTGTRLFVVGSDSEQARIVIDTFAGNPTLNYRRANGTATAKTALLAGDSLLNMTGFGYGATGYSSSGRVGVIGYAAENWTDSAQGTYLGLFTTSTGGTTNTERWRVNSTGDLTAGTNNAWNIGGGFSGGVGTGNPAAIYAESKLASRKLTLYDNTNSIAIPGEWDLNVVASGVGAAAQSNFYIRNNAGANMLMIEAVNGGGTVDRSIFYTDIIPDAANTRKVGTSSVPFAEVNADAATFDALTLPTGSSVGYVWTDQGSGVGAWAEGGRDAYDVRNFGAVCDGTTDDTTAIENAISAGAANKHKAILPQGTCKVTTIDISNSYGGIRGQGRSNSILYSTTNAPIIKVDNAGPLYYLEFSDFMLKGSEAGTSQTGIESATAGFGVSTIHNLYFENLWRGIKLGHTTNLGDNNIFDCAFSMGGNAVAAASLVNGTTYVIGSVGTTDFTLIGAASNTVGLSFTKSGSAGTGTGVAYLSSTFSKVGIESLHTSSGSIWSRNFFGGLALPSSATQGPRAFYLHGYVGDLLLNDNHMEGGWIAFDISCDNGTFATGACSYGENLVIQGNKIDGYSKDFRLYNLQNSTILGNRCLSCVKDANVSGTQTKGMIFDVVGRTDLGDAIYRAGWRLTTSYGDLALNAYDEGRIRIGDTSSDISFTKNGISILDASYSSAVALGQSASRNMGMFWTRDATAANAYGVIYTYGYSNPMLYGASAHSFTGGKMSVTNAGPSLGSGQNIADIWATGSTGFVSLGVYRTDDTNGGWLVGTSAVSAGDFAIYQNQGAGTPAKRFLIDTSGTVDIPGNLSVAVMNATGSPAYRVSGTTVIDASRHATFVNLTSSGTITLSGTVASDILFGSSNTYLIGNSTNYLNAIHANNVVAYASFLPASGVSTVDVGSATRRIRKTYTGDLDITGTVTPPSGTAFTGTKTVRASGGASDCTLTFSSGIMTGGTC